MSKLIQRISLALILFFGIGLSSPALGQGDGGQIPGGDGGVIPGPVDPGQVDTGGQQGSGDVSTDRSSEGVGDIRDTIDLESTPDQRNQGFIGATADRIQETGFVGRPGAISGPGLAEGATLGGGVNSSVGSNINIGTSATGGARGGFGAVTGNGVSIVRRSLRARLVPSFVTPRLDSASVISRFNSRLVLQPGAENFGSGYSISVQERTATITGSVRTQDDSDRLERQLRLEPGIYKIENRLQILN